MRTDHRKEAVTDGVDQESVEECFIDVAREERTLSAIDGLDDQIKKVEKTFIGPLTNPDAGVRTNSVLICGDDLSAPCRFARRTVGSLQAADVTVIAPGKPAETNDASRPRPAFTTGLKQSTNLTPEDLAVTLRAMVYRNEPCVVCLKNFSDLVYSEAFIESLRYISSTNAPVAILASVSVSSSQNKLNFNNTDPIESVRVDLRIRLPKPDVERQVKSLETAIESVAENQQFEVNLERRTLQSIVSTNHDVSIATLDTVATRAALHTQEDYRSTITGGDVRSAYNQIMAERETADPIAERIEELYRPTVPDVTFEDIGGMDRIKERLRETLEFPRKYASFFENSEFGTQSSLLLYGPPGTGKTMLAKAIANHTERSFFAINGAEMKSMWFGRSEKLIRNLFRAARSQSPSLIFFDEFDTLAAERVSMDSSTAESMVGTLLAELDGLEDRGDVVVIAATNRLEALDPAIRRSGRFGEAIEVGPPDQNGRREIFRHYLRGIDTDADVTAKWCAGQIPDGTTGADIEVIVERASFAAIREADTSEPLLTRRHLLEAIEEIVEEGQPVGREFA